MLGHKTSFNKFQKIKIIYVFSDNRTKLEVNNRHSFFVKLLTVFVLLLSLLSILMIIIWTLYLTDNLSALSLVLSLEFYLVPSFGTYCSVPSFCLTVCVSFSLLGKSVTFPDLGDVALCRRCLYTSNKGIYIVNQLYFNWKKKSIWSLFGSQILPHAEAAGSLVGRAGSLSSWLLGLEGPRSSAHQLVGR